MLTRCRVVCALSAILIASVPSWTQQDSTPTFKSKTDVVLVPVIVKRKNEPVEGLKAEQFTVQEDGKQQRIASVELIKTVKDLKRVQARGEFSNELVAPGPARLSIIAIDMINTPFLDQAYAREQVLKYLAGAVKTDEQVAIVGMYANGSVRLIHDISNDSATLAQAVKGLTGVVNAADPSSVANSNRRELESQLMGSNPNASVGDPSLTRAVDEAQALQEYKSESFGTAGFALRRRLEATLTSMQQIGAAYAGAPGRKTFIWITGSFPFEIGGSAELTSPIATFSGTSQDAGHYQAQHSGALPPLPESQTMVDDTDLAPLRQQFHSMLQQFANANVVMYPVDARGLMALSLDASESHYNQILQDLKRTKVAISQLTMENMSKLTGGKACYNKNEIADCVNEATRDSDEYYLLSYYRDKKRDKPGWRKLSVKVNQPDVEVRARTGYYYGSDPADKNARTRAVSEALASRVPFSAVGFSARFFPATAAGNTKTVKYEIYIPPSTIELADQGDGKLQFEVIAVASSAKDPKVDQVAELIGGNLPPQAIAAIHQQGIAYNSALKLPPGQYLVRFLVRNTADNAIGTVMAPLRVD